MKKIIIILLILINMVFCAKGINKNRNTIIKNAKKYIGVKYRYGGITPKGFDCSGFVQYVYKKSGYSIPRTVTSIMKNSRKIKNPLPGDFIVFNNPKHIGIYYKDNLFIHASSSKGVIIESFNKKYYKKRFIGFYTIF